MAIKFCECGSLLRDDASCTRKGCERNKTRRRARDIILVGGQKDISEMATQLAANSGMTEEKAKSILEEMFNGRK